MVIGGDQGQGEYNDREDHSDLNGQGNGGGD